MNRVERTFHDLWPLFLLEGASLIVLGALAIVMPSIMGLISAILLGWLLLVSGLVGLVATLANPAAPGFRLSILSSVLSAAIGLVLFSWPAGDVVWMTVALGLFLALDGLLAISIAFEHRRHLKPKWKWLLANGLLDIVFASFLLLWLPRYVAADMFGLIVGIDLVAGGATACAMAWDERRARLPRDSKVSST